MLFNSACVIVLGDGFGPPDGSGKAGDGQTFELPEPDQWQVDPVERTPEQQRKAEEADAYIAKHVYEGRPIVKTVQTYSGDILDYMKVPPLDIPIPEIPPLLESPVLPEGVTLGLTEVEKYPEFWGPIDTTVFKRPDFSRYIMDDTGATSIEDWLENHQVHGVPDDPHRLYAGLNIAAPNRGVSARINQFHPEVADRSFSLIELAVACPAVGPAQELVGVMLTVDRVNLGGDKASPPVPRLRVEYYSDVNGKVVGSYDKWEGHFKEELVRPTDLGMALDEVSVPGGPQVEYWLAIVMDPLGNWWITYNGKLLGHYPAHLFTMLNQGACRTSLYGEVYNPTPEQGRVKTEMGSGQFHTAPAGHVAWVREPKYLDMNWFVTDPKDDAFAAWSKPYEATCYSRSSMVDLGTPWQYLLLGGPGGKDPLCTTP
jgi:hypothetical protein